jgi:hypothetical protein
MEKLPSFQRASHPLNSLGHHLLTGVSQAVQGPIQSIQNKQNEHLKNKKMTTVAHSNAGIGPAACNAGAQAQEIGSWHPPLGEAQTADSRRASRTGERKVIGASGAGCA